MSASIFVPLGSSGPSRLCYKLGRRTVLKYSAIIGALLTGTIRLYLFVTRVSVQAMK
ncbi:MAG TPA: hypothetical protein VH415_16030 [Nitrososphaeraceae archaeon]|jgi:hypothetical protein